MSRVATAALALVVVAFAWGAPGRAPAQEAGELSGAERTAIRAVIEHQLAAFRRDDGVEAFSYASPTIRRRFATPENFMAMVRQGYQPVYRPRRVSFGDLVDVEGEPVQRVHLVGPDGVPAIALYVMQRQPDGSWKINACYLVAAADESA